MKEFYNFNILIMKTQSKARKNQSYRKIFKKINERKLGNNFSNLNFPNWKPRTNEEREYLLELNNTLKDINETITVDKLPRKVHFFKGKSIIKPVIVFKFDNTDIDYECFSLKLENTHNLWNIFGEHYFGYKLREQLSPEQLLKIELRICRRDKSDLYFFKEKLKKKLLFHLGDKAKGVNQDTKLKYILNRKTKIK